MMKKVLIRTLSMVLAALLLAGSLPAFLPGINMNTLLAEEADGADSSESESSEKNDDKESITFHITLDPGHGGVDTGAEAFGTCEKVLTLKLAKMLKEELLKYDNVTVDLTRKKDKFVALPKRTKKALEQNADLMISLHFDSYDPSCQYSSGCSAIVAKKKKYRPAIAKEERKIARSILKELSDSGVKNHGLIRRLSGDGETYPDGSPADYYGIIRRGMINKLPAILVEHAFIDSEHDFDHFLESDEKLRELAKADARGIARYLRLQNKKTGKILKPSKDHGKILTCYGKQGSYIKLRDKSFNLASYRQSANMNPEEMEETENESKAALTESEEGKEQEKKTADGESGLAAGGVLSEREQQSLWLICLLLGLLLAYYALDTVRRRKYNQGAEYEN